MVEYGALEQCLREGFIDYTVEADQRYVPKILTNNKEKKRKVLDTILSQLYVCDSFLFSVAFFSFTSFEPQNQNAGRSKSIPMAPTGDITSRQTMSPAAVGIRNPQE